VGKTKVGKGMKLEIVVEASGLPLGLKAAAADVSEQQLLMPALDDVPIKVPSGTPVVADKGHDSDPLRDKMENAGYTPVIPHRSNRVKPSRNDGRRLRRYNPAIKLISFQPATAFHGLEGLKHMDSAIVPGIYDPALADEDLRVESERAYEMVRCLARVEGALAGISSGAALAATLDVARRLDRGVIVTVFPDGAEKYLTEKFWNADA